MPSSSSARNCEHAINPTKEARHSNAYLSSGDVLQGNCNLSDLLHHEVKQNVAMRIATITNDHIV